MQNTTRFTNWKYPEIIEGKPTQQTADKIINYLIDEEINCFDTAIAYGDSEKVLGCALKTRSDVNLISKVKSELFTTNLEETIHQSLKHLHTSKLFGLLLHDCELLYNWNEEFTTKVIALQKQGLIDYFGVSIYTAEEFELAIENPIIRFIQIPFNIFDQRAVNDEWFKKAKKANKLIFIRSVFLQGLFFMDLNQLSGNLLDARPYLEKLHAIRTEIKLSVSEFAMAYVDTVAIDSVILFGCDTLDQAKENIRSYNDLPLIGKEILDTINVLFTDIPEYITNPGLWSLK